LRRSLREPLLHFLLLGTLLFAVYGALRGSEDGARDAIVVTRARIDNLAAVFERTWQRPPGPGELDALVESYVREEVLYREGLALGLDRDDPVVRNRVRLKMEFIGEGAGDEPGDAELQAWLDGHAAEYAIEPRFRFEQVYSDQGRNGGATLLPAEMDDASTSDVAAIFGEAFAAELAKLEPRRWRDAVRSSFGLHRVRVLERSDGRAPTLAEVRDAVARDWSAARARDAKERLYQSLRERYSVTVEREPVEPPAPLADAR
jgi:hypothetical protein